MPGTIRPSGRHDAGRHLAVGALAVAVACAGAYLLVAPLTSTPLLARAAPTTTTMPGPSTTGVPPGVVLTRRDGDLTITVPGAVYDGLDIHGFVTVKAPGVRITRSVIRGGVATGNRGLVNDYDPRATDFVLEDSELVPEHPSAWIDGIKGANFTLRRVDVHGTTDAVKVHGDHVRVEDSWLHDTVRREADPNVDGQATHNDGVQVLGGRDIQILGNTITGNENAALQVTQDYSATTDLRFSGNWVDGGGCSLNLAHKKLLAMTDIMVTDNRFGRATRLADCAILATPQTTVTASGNVWNGNGRPVHVLHAAAHGSRDPQEQPQH